ncbi:beta-ketoacyl synthase N-terminal-like domain-containing protein [Marinicrinis sediminis]|uniref:Beta-ketoacyl synthase N-terminal-like domain-containing protein n=1 Tax=Marinicrinis sediminis TaxID=1652465 RepID=A0ABW5RE10_9BACL
MSTAHSQITGTAMLTSSGQSSEEVWKAVCEQRAAISERHWQMNGETAIVFPCYAIGSVDLRQWISSSAIQQIRDWGLAEDRDFTYLVAVIAGALSDAKCTEEMRKSSRISLVIGHENLGVVKLIDQLMQDMSQQESAWQRGFESSFTQYQQHYYQLQSFPYLYYLSRLFDLNGLTYTVNNACASGLYAIELGDMLLKSNQTDMVVVACSDYAHVTEYLWLKEKGAMSTGQQLKPFDSTRDGSVLGDGAGAIVMERRESMEHRKQAVHCYAVYAGGTFAQESWHMTLPDVTQHTYANVIERAIRQWVTPERRDHAVDLLVPHGTGSPMWDRYEASEIQRAWTACQLPPPFVTAFKGYIGHTLGASSMIEAILMIHCLKHQCVPRTLNADQPDPQLRLPIAEQTRQVPLHTAVKSVPAYGGFHVAAVFKRGE